MLESDAVIRELCGQIAKEEDTEKINELVASLRELIKDEHEEARLRIWYLVKHYHALAPSLVLESLPADPVRKRGVVPLLLSFLGIEGGKEPSVPGGEEGAPVSDTVARALLKDVA